MDNQEQKERRKYARYPLRKDILIDDITKAYSQNISEDGMFLCTIHPLEKGSIINVTIPSKFTVKAEVINNQPGIGTGIKFIDLNYDQKIKIKQLIEDIKLEGFI